MVWSGFNGSAVVWSIMSWCPQIYFLSCPHISRDVNPSKAQKEGTQATEFCGEVGHKTWMRRDHTCCVKCVRVKNEQTIKLWVRSSIGNTRMKKPITSLIYLLTVGLSSSDWQGIFFNQSAIDGLEKKFQTTFNSPSLKRAGWLKFWVVSTSHIRRVSFSWVIY